MQVIVLQSSARPCKAKFEEGRGLELADTMAIMRKCLSTLHINHSNQHKGRQYT